MSRILGAEAPVVEPANAHARAVILHLAETHGAHTALLYGSRTTGLARPDSDYDLLLVRASGPALRDVRAVGGLMIDAFIEEEARLDPGKDPGLMRLRNGVVLRDDTGFGSALIERVRAVFDRGPDALPRDEVVALQTWGRKMLARIEQTDVSANYRRAELLSALLPTYFQVRGKWFLGPKESLEQLAREAPRALAAFEAALVPGATDAAIADLVALVLEEGAGDAGRP